MIRLPLYVLLLVSMASTAQVYKTIEEDGSVTYSDTPSVGEASQQIEVRKPNTSAPPPEMPRLEGDSAPQEPEQTSYEVAITAPANETTFPMGPGNFSVSARVEPSPEPGTALQLYLDGAPQGVPQDSANWSLTNVFRGAHDLSVAVVDGKGNELARSEAVRVYVLRPSVNFKNRN
jgi:hypothetical protein